MPQENPKRDDKGCSQNGMQPLSCISKMGSRKPSKRRSRFTIAISLTLAAALALLALAALEISASLDESTPSRKGPISLIFEVSDKIRPSKKKDVPAMPYHDSIADAAQRYDLDPYLIAGVIQTESGFQEGTGNAYACGLMGVSDIGAQEMNIRGIVDPSEYPPGLISDPDVNIHYGSAILRCFLDQYGDLDTALAAYNAGPVNADRWVGIAAGGDIASVIDIAETRAYLKRVPENAKMMKDKYPDAF